MRVTGIGERIAAAYSASREQLWALFSQGLTSGANFATTVILIRATGLAEFGRFSIAFLILMISRNFLNGTVLMPMSTIAPKLRGVSSRSYRGFLLANGVAFSLGTSMILYLVMTALGWLTGTAWLSSVAGGLALANFAANTADFFRRYQFVVGHAFRAFMVDVVRFAVQLGIMLAVALQASEILSANLALLILALGSGIATLCGGLWFGSPAWRKSLSAAVWPRHLHFIKWMTPGIALKALQMQAPMFLGAALLGEVAVGGVRAMQQTINLVNLPFNALDNVLPSISARTYAKSGAAALQTLLRRTLVASSIFLTATSAALVALWPFVAPLLRVQDQGLGTVIPLLATSFANIFSLIWTMKLLAYEKPNLITKSFALSAGANLPPTVALIALFGSVGIAWAIFSNAAVLQFLLMRACARSSKA